MRLIQYDQIIRTIMSETIKKASGIVIAFLVILSFASCTAGRKISSANSTVTPLSGTGSFTDGSLVYALPLTVLDIYVEVERTVEKPGPYSDYANELLGLSDVIRQERERWSIKNITLDTHSEIDPSQYYIIEASRLFETNALMLRRTGLILDLSPEQYNNAEVFYDNLNSASERIKVTNLGSDEYFVSYKDTLYRLVKLDTSFVRLPYLVEKKQILTTAQLAERAARQLMEIREGKHMILTGETNVFPQDDAAINELNRLEKEYTELFTGKKASEIKTFSFHINPVKEAQNTKLTIFRFSETDGLLPADHDSGIPVSIELIPDFKTKNLNLIRKIQPGKQAQTYDKLYYRIPDVVTLRISYGDKMLNSSRRLIYQFGETVALPSNYIIGNRVY